MPGRVYSADCRTQCPAVHAYMRIPKPGPRASVRATQVVSHKRLHCNWQMARHKSVHTGDVVEAIARVCRSRDSPFSSVVVVCAARGERGVPPRGGCHREGGANAAATRGGTQTCMHGIARRMRPEYTPITRTKITNAGSPAHPRKKSMRAHRVARERARASEERIALRVRGRDHLERPSPSKHQCPPHVFGARPDAPQKTGRSSTSTERQRPA